MGCRNRVSTLESSFNKLLGTKLQDAPIPLELKKACVNGREYKNEIIRLNNTELNINKVFMQVKQNRVGTVITFQEVKGIQDLESKIRKKIYSRGHIARSTFEDLIGESEVMQHLVNTAIKYSQTNSNILLIGKSGTGKEILAQSIHNSSKRSKGPFVAVNCAALPEQLLESELFGYVEGAFTGAAKGGKPGYFELAHGGTMFLDEISEMPLRLQSTLLRVIQEKEVVRLGDDKVIPVDMRLIFATNRDLYALVNSGEFREDLLYRIDVLRINIPPLESRKQDIPLLIEHYLKKHFPNIEISNEAKQLMQTYSWPGNVRQLFNYCERIAVLCKNERIEESDVLTIHGIKNQQNLPKIPEQIASERDKIIYALKKTKYHRQKAADILGINRSTLWRKMKQYQIN